MSAKYTSCRHFDCMDRPFGFPALTSCVGEYYKPACDLAMPYDREILGECAESYDLSDWAWWEYREVKDAEGNLIMSMDDDARLAMIESIHGVINSYGDP